MKVIRGAELRFLRTTTAGELRSGLRNVPDEAEIDVHKDVPKDPTPLDKGGMVTISAHWEAEVELFPAEEEQRDIEVEFLAEHHSGRREFLVTLGPPRDGYADIDPDTLRQWANRRQEIIWVSALLDGLADAMETADE